MLKIKLTRTPKKGERAICLYLIQKIVQLTNISSGELPRYYDFKKASFYTQIRYAADLGTRNLTPNKLCTCLCLLHFFFDKISTFIVELIPYSQ